MSGAFSVDFGRAANHLCGRGVFLGGTGGLGRVAVKLREVVVVDHTNHTNRQDQ